MLLCSQLGSKSEWSEVKATATIEKSFTHPARDVAQQEARAAPTHEACSGTTKLNQTKSTRNFARDNKTKPRHSVSNAR